MENQKLKNQENKFKRLKDKFQQRLNYLDQKVIQHFNNQNHAPS